ncbi:hypothetical protein [Streptomyces sp. PSKA30]|uniref:hypothetical protein n=1 Tax=Streptomyces sp. PSKA30 TaxID=2874597 RepID=UPI001CD06291|nr:hypothetical protein [Streptomyces sp. PSKA30]MBZ9642813.1 hypothetical protein [Streptomyces sp. PSKA30]
MTHYLRSASALIWTSAALLTVAACSGSSVENKASATDPEVLAAQNIDLPLDRYMFTEFEIHDLSSLLLTRTQACMKEHGHADTDLPKPPDPGVSQHNERRYGITDGRLAERLGYRTPAQRARLGTRGEEGALRRRGVHPHWRQQ